MEWKVVLPDKAAAPMGARKPRGSVIADPGGEHEEVVWVPKAVARKLKAKADSGEAVIERRSDLFKLIDDASKACAVQRVERLLNARDYSVKEVTDKLRLDGYRQSVIDDVVGRAVAGGLIDDRRFADAYARGRISAGWGQGRIERELRRRGIEAEEALPGWPEGYIEPEDEPERAYQIAARRRLTGKNDFQKLVRFLCSRGFSTGIAIGAARRVLDEANQEDLSDKNF